MQALEQQRPDVKRSSAESTAAARICSHHGAAEEVHSEPADERSGGEHEERELERERAR